MTLPAIVTLLYWPSFLIGGLSGQCNWIKTLRNHSFSMWSTLSSNANLYNNVKYIIFMVKILNVKNKWKTKVNNKSLNRNYKAHWNCVKSKNSTFNIITHSIHCHISMLISDFYSLWTNAFSSHDIMVVYWIKTVSDY